MIYKFIFFLLIGVCICFIPIYSFMYFLYKKLNFYSNSNNIIDEIEKINNYQNQLKKEIDEQIKNLEENKQLLEKEQNKLN